MQIFASLLDILKQVTKTETMQMRITSLVARKMPDPGNAVYFVAARVFAVQTSMCIMETSALLLAFKLTRFIF